MALPRALRCVTLNLWGVEAPLAERMAVVREGLRALQPDVVALQEVREGPEQRNQAEELADALDYHCAFAAATPVGDGQEGLAILSRYAITERAAIELPHARPDERRILLSVRIAHPAAAVWVHTTHLNYRLTHGREREDQVVAVDAEVAPRGTETPQIIMGDFNARPESDEIRFLTGLTTLGGRRVMYQDAWALLHPDEPGITWAASNPYTRRLRFLQQDRRLDYVFVTPMRRDGRGAILDCRVVLDRPTAAGVYASDHYGVLVDVQVVADAPAVGS